MRTFFGSTMKPIVVSIRLIEERSDAVGWGKEGRGVGIKSLRHMDEALKSKDEVAFVL